MKKIYIFLLLFISNVGFGQTFMAQTDPPILGKVCPDFQLSILTHTGGEKTISLRDLKGKIVILEFWATYCKPCIPSLTHFDKLQAQFGNNIKIIAISDENRDKVDPFLLKHNYKFLNFSMDWGRKVNDMFFHHFIPHTVVIDQDQVVRAFTSPDEIDDAAIGKLINREPVGFVMKHEFQEDANRANASVEVSQPTVIYKIPEPSYRFDFSENKPPLSTEYQKISDTELKFVNAPLSLMYQVLYGQRNNRLIFEVEKTEKYTGDEPEYRYCFQLNVPPTLGKTVQEVGIHQLEYIFPLRSKLEARSRKAFVLQKADIQPVVTAKDSSRIVANGFTLNNLIDYLESNQHLIENLPVVNETGLDGNLIIDVDWFQRYSDSIENKLKTLGLQREIKEVALPCLVLYEPDWVAKNQAMMKN
jgi:peroxiredoxin